MAGFKVQHEGRSILMGTAAHIETSFCTSSRDVVRGPTDKNLSKDT